MFTQNRYGSNTKIYKQDGNATVKLLTFVAIVGTIGAVAWALFSAFENFTQGVNRTWTPNNNDTLINRFADVFGTLFLLITVGVMLAVVAPWIIRNWKIALMTPIPNQPRQSYNLVEGEANEGLHVLDETPVYGLLTDNSHEEHFLQDSFKSQETLEDAQWK